MSQRPVLFDGNGHVYRPKAQYESAQYNHLTAHMHSRCLPSYDELKGGVLYTLRARSRWVCNNHPLAAGVVKKLKRRVAGAGMKFQARLRGKDGTYLRAESKMLEDVWELNASDFSVDGKTWRTFAQQAIATRFRDGEVFLVKSLRNGRKPISREWQIIEGDQVAENADSTLEAEHCKGSKNKVRLGVEVTPQGRPVAYYFYTDGNSSASTYSVDRSVERVPADRVHHWANFPRVGVTRGIPELTPVILLWADEEEFRKATLTTAWAQACFTAFITTQMSYETQQIQSGQTTQDAQGNKRFLRKLEPLTIEYLEPNESITLAEPKSPPEKYAEFSAEVQRAGSAGIDLSYETVARNFSKTNYSSGRQIALDDNGAFDEWAADFDESIGNIVWRDFVDFVYTINRVLPEPQCQSIYSGALQHPQQGWVDPDKEQKAWAGLISSRLASPMEGCASRGRDPFEVLDEIKDFNDYAASIGLKEQSAPTPTPVQQSTESNDDPDEDDSAEGEE